MSKINQIQNALNEMEGGAFQKLADTYLLKKGYQNINAIGSVIGSNKVKKGTPDSYSRQVNGKLVFAEYTTDKTNLSKKFDGDLEKCLDPSKTGISIDEIEEIVFCHNSQLSLSDEQNLYKKCQAHGIKIQLYGIDNISFDLYQKYPALAQDFLGISIDTGQIVSPDDFIKSVGKNQISTPLDTEFHYREEELREIEESIESDDLIILSGPAGVGKSRLALKAIEEFQKNNESYDVYVIYNKGPDVFEDIRTYFSESGNFLILVDDANRITQFDYVADLIQNQRDDQSIKSIVTVRDYARDKILSSAKSISNVSEIELKPMKAEEISALVEELYDIKNPAYQERISDIAGGNPRLAIMAAMIATKENSLSSIRDVTALYDEYFSSISVDLKKLKNTNILKVAGILSFFRSVDRSYTQLMDQIQLFFDVSPNEFWEAAQFLHESEIVDIYEKEVAKINDQVFSTYLFYSCFFKGKIFCFSTILNNLFPDKSEKIKDALYPCLNSFDFDVISKEIKGDVKEIWDKYIENNDTKNIDELINTFWFLLQSDVLVYIRDRIAAMAEVPCELESISFEEASNSLSSHPILETLSLFRQASDESTFKAALELAFNYVDKNPGASPSFIKLMIDNFGFNRHSHKSDYAIQTILIKSLWDKTKDGEDKLFARLFIEVTAKYLKTHYDCHEGNKRTITIYKFDLLPTETIFSLRKIIWEGLFKLYAIDDARKHVVDTISSYCRDGYYLTRSEIVKNDSEYLIPFIEKTFNPDSFSECLIVQKYSRFLENRGISSAKNLGDKFQNETYQAYKVLALDYGDIETENYDEFTQIKQDKINSYIENFDYEDFIAFIDRATEIVSITGEGHEAYQINNGINEVFIALGEKDSKIFKDVIKCYLSSGNLLKLSYPYQIISQLISYCGKKETLAFIAEPEYSFKKHWLFNYYGCLDESDITSKEAKSLLLLYASASPSEIPYDFDYLLKYLHADSDVVRKVVEVIVEKFENDRSFGRCLNILFNHLTEVNKQLFEILAEHMPLIKRSYLIHCKTDNHPDYSGATLRRILDKDSEFLVELIDNIYADEEWPDIYSDHRNYSFLWELENYEITLNSAITKILDKELERGYISGQLLERFFGLKNNNECSSEIKDKQDNLLKNLIENYSSEMDLMRLIFKVISEFKEDRRIQFVELFLKKNNSYQDFEKISLEPNHWGGSGSLVPVYQARVDYWEELLPLCSTVDLLDHKLFVEQKIKTWRQRVEQAKREDFVDEI